jgi:hypothetical protein
MQTLRMDLVGLALVLFGRLEITLERDAFAQANE